jgi:flagellar basal-body rod modification protein FlgD
MTDAVTSNNSVLQNYLNQQAKDIAADKAAAATAAQTDTGISQLGSNFNTFIKILTTQLQHQDPTNATDPNQFTQELVQFAGVEQQLGTNSKLDKLIALQNNNNATTAALGYIGQYVEATTDSGQMPLQDGKAEIGFTLPSAAAGISIVVKDSTGKAVAALDAPKTAGLHYVTWDGKDKDGNQLADGTYTFTVVATDSSTNAPLTITDTRAIGKVTGVVSNSDGTANLSLGDTSVSTSKVDKVFTTGNLPDAA